MPTSEEILYNAIIKLASKYMAERGMKYVNDKDNETTNSRYPITRQSDKVS